MVDSDIFSATLTAKEIIKSLGIEEPSDIDIEAIAMERGVIVKEGYLKGAEGRLSTLGSYGLITVKSDIPEPSKKRFVIAHELGHYELHRKKAPAFRCSDKDFSEWLKKRPLEVEANHFAAELLMPESLFRKKVAHKDLSMKLLKDLKEEFKTSLTATGIRFVTFVHEYALICTGNDKIKWFFINKEFPYYLNVSGGIHPESIAFDFFKGIELPDGFTEVSPEAWIDDSKFKDSAKVMEMAIGIPTYKQVLSFIHIFNSEEDESDDCCKELDGHLRFR